ncbi:MAG: peptidoglycan editing factor PgeF [Gammaproteobacteria bacterium]|nr:peptidoglycan editing factor PgeF [Gammaproteobacteria bacterium]
MNEFELIVPDWPAPGNVRACATTREGGVSEQEFCSLNLASHVGDRDENVAENRKRLRVFAGLPAEPRWLNQAHGNRIADLSRSVPVSADAAVGNGPGQVCTILTADCLPILLCSVDGAQVGAVHAGWRGLAGGVIEATVKMMSHGGQRLLAWLGPAIGPAAYQVGAEVRQAFVENSQANGTFFADDGPGHWRADLYGLARRLLEARGVAVFGGGFCTHSDSRRFFSYRRDGQCGRQASLIWLE